MALTFPTLSSGSMTVKSPLTSYALMKYPAQLQSRFVTRTLVFLNDTEQRFTVRNFLFSCVLQYNKLNGFDVSVLRDFFNTMLGMYVDDALLFTFSINIAGVTYNYCVFDQDEFAVTADRGETFTLELKIKQIRPN